MALQRLEIEFGSEQNPTIMVQSRIDAVTRAIATPSPIHNHNITQDQYGNTLLGGWVTPPEGGTISETDNYVLTANGVHVLADSSQIETQQYLLNTGVMNKLYEGGSVQLYCINSANNANVTMTSMTVWVYLHFGQSTGLSGVDRNEVMSCLNCTDWVQYDPTLNIWRGKLQSYYGILDSSILTTKNAGWDVMMSLRAYPSLIDQDPNTTDEIRESRCTPAFGTDGACSLNYQAIDVDGLEIFCSNQVPTSGDHVHFSITRLLPTTNTKQNAPGWTLQDVVDRGISWSVVDSNNVPGVVSGGDYTVQSQGQPTAFTVSASINYMDEQITARKQYPISTAILSQTSNNKMFKAVKDALQDWVFENWDPIQATSLTNLMAENVPGSYIEAIMTNAFKEGATSFEELRYFSQINTLYIPANGDGNEDNEYAPNTTMRNISSPFITRIYGPGTMQGFQRVNGSTDFPNVTTIEAGRLFQGNTVLTLVEFPSLRSINITEAGGYDACCFDGCSQLVTFRADLLDTISSRDCYLFRGCNMLVNIDLSRIGSFSCTRSNGMFKNCAALGGNSSLGGTHLFTFSSNDLQLDGDNCIFEGCTSLTSYDLSGVTALRANTPNDGSAPGDLNMFKGCTALRTVLLSNQQGQLLTQINAGHNIALFDGCTQLQRFSSTGTDIVDLSTVINMTAKNNYMFRNCTRISQVDMPTNMTYQVTTDDAMFEGCRSINNPIYMPPVVTIGSAANPGNITMFKGCTALQTVVWSSLTNVYATNNEMFYGCSSLQTADTVNNTGLIIPNVTILSNGNQANPETGSLRMFYGCSSLGSITLNGLTNIKYKGDCELFKNCTGITSVNMTLLTTINGTTGTDTMFDGCSNLTTVNMPQLSSYSTGISQLFKGNQYITSINLSSLATITCDTSEMFMNYTMGNIVLPSLNTIQCSMDNRTFSGATHFGTSGSTTSVSFPGLLTLSATNGAMELFKGCSALTSISLPSIIGISSTTNNMFQGCTSLHDLTFGKYSENQSPLSISGNCQNMFNGVPAANIKAIIDSSEMNNELTSRISQLNASNMFYNMTLNLIAFPNITTAPQEGTFNFTADRIKLGSTE